MEEEAELMDSDTDRGEEGIVVAADACWTSGRVGVENSDAFCVYMSLRGDPPSWVVGAPLVVSLRVLNLSMEPQDLMLLMDKDGEGEKDDSGLQWERTMRGTGGRGRGEDVKMVHQHSKAVQRPKENHRFNTAVVYEVNGYTFGVWGFSGGDDGTTHHHRDHKLLAVDAAIVF